MRERKRGVVLVGHGGIPKDCPYDLVMKLKRLEAQRRSTGGAPTAEEVELDRRIRRWPRTGENDPYQSGLEALATRLKPLLDGSLFRIAYNEYCAPTLEEAVEELLKEGVGQITVISSMLTPGGSHAEIEIPQTIDRLRRTHPGVVFRYAWPFDLDLVAGMLATQVKRFAGRPGDDETEGRRKEDVFGATKRVESAAPPRGTKAVRRAGRGAAMVRDELAQAFLATGSFKWDPQGGFKLASGLTSPFYVDCRALMAHPGPRALVARAAWEVLKDLEFDCIGGLELGAISIATTLSDYGFRATPRRDWRTFVVRKQPKDHGLGKLIEGAVQAGDRALIVDDVLTSGGSLLKAVAAAREAGLDVRYALVIVDRKEQGGRANVERQGVTLFSLLTIDDLRRRHETAPMAAKT